MHGFAEKTHAFFTLRCVYSCEGAFTFSSFNEEGDDAPAVAGG